MQKTPLIHFATNYSRREVHYDRMEDQREVDALLEHLAEKLEMKDVEPHEIASMIAITMYEEFNRNGIKEQIDTAISFAQMSLRYEHNKPEITNGLLSNLGVFLESRYERMGDIADLKEAIQVTRRAVASTPEDHSDLAGRLNNLGNKLESRYEWTGDMADLKEAIQVAQRAVTSTPEDHSDLAAILNNLATSLRAGTSGQETWPTSRRPSKSLNEQSHQHLKTTPTWQAG